MGNARIGIHQNLSDANYVARNHVLVTNAGIGMGSAKQISAASVPFSRAFAYGLKAAQADGSGYTANVGTVCLGEKDAAGNLYCIDPILNDPTQPVVFQAPPGVKLDLKDFYLQVANANDGVLIKYH